MKDSSAIQNPEDDPQVSYLVLRLFDEYVVQPTAHLPVTSRLRKQLHEHFDMPDSEAKSDGQHNSLKTNLVSTLRTYTTFS